MKGLTSKAHNVEQMLDLTNKEKQRRLCRSTTEWEESFLKLEASLGYWFADVKTILKGPKDETNKTKLRHVTSEASTNAAMRCPHTRKLSQTSFNPTKRKCSVEVTSEKKSLSHTSRVTDEERRVIGVSNTSDAINSIKDVKMLPEQIDNSSVKAASKSNRSTVSSKSSNAEQILLLEWEAMKKQYEIDEQLAAKKRQAKIQKKQEEMHLRILAEQLKTSKLEEESPRTKQVANHEKELG